MPVFLPELFGALYKLRYIQKGREPGIAKGTSGGCKIQFAPLACGKLILQVFELGFLRQALQTDQIILPAVIGERYVIWNFGRQFAGGSTVYYA